VNPPKATYDGPNGRGGCQIGPTYLCAIGGDSGAVRIALSVHPLRMRDQLQNGNQQDLRVLAQRLGTQEDVDRIKTKLAGYRLRGAWFERDPALGEFNLADEEAVGMERSPLDVKRQEIRQHQSTQTKRLSIVGWWYTFDDTDDEGSLGRAEGAIISSLGDGWHLVSRWEGGDYGGHVVAHVSEMARWRLEQSEADLEGVSGPRFSSTRKETR
jgi:hypothetical protein